MKFQSDHQIWLAYVFTGVCEQAWLTVQGGDSKKKISLGHKKFCVSILDLQQDPI